MLRAMAERLVYSSIPVNVNSLSCIVIGAQEQGGRTIRSEPVQRCLPVRNRSRTRRRPRPRQLWWGEAPERGKPPIYLRLEAGSV
jgi:hypothetical protein